MSSELTDKIYIAIVAGVGRIYMTKSQAETVKMAMEDPDVRSVIVGDSKLRVQSIHAVVRAGEVEDGDRVKQGDYKCKFGQWHARGITCNCAEAKRLGMLG